jgi:hypothetical protein
LIFSQLWRKSSPTLVVQGKGTRILVKNAQISKG